MTGFFQHGGNNDNRAILPNGQSYHNFVSNFVYLFK